MSKLPFQSEILRFRRTFIWYFLAIGSSILLGVFVHNWIVGQTATQHLNLLGLGLAGLVAWINYKGTPGQAFLVLSIAHFLLAILHFLPEVVQNGNVGMGNHVLAYCQLTLLLCVNGWMAPGLWSWSLFTATTFAVAGVDLALLPHEDFSARQIIALVYFLVTGSGASLVVFFLVQKIHLRFEHQLKKSDVLEAEKNLKALKFAQLGHDMRSPLTAALYSLDALEATELSPQQSQYLKILRQAQGLMLEDLETYLRGNLPETWKDDPEPVDPARFCQDLCNLFRPAAQRKELTLDYDGPESSPTSHLPKHLLRHILSNLLSNAVRYTPTGGVTLSYHCDDKAHHFQVADTGPGLLPDRPDSGFEKSYGLGMGIVRNLVPLIGGTLDVQSGPQGTTFTLKLPATRP